MSTLTSADFGELKRPTTRVHAPPGGGSSWSISGGGDDDAPQQTRQQQQRAKRDATAAAAAVPHPSAAGTAIAPVAATAGASTPQTPPPNTVRIAVVKTKADAEIVDLVAQNVLTQLQTQSSPAIDTQVFTVATLDELPYAANKLTRTRFDAVVVVGFLNTSDALFSVLSSALTQALIDISVANVKPIVRALFIGEPRVAAVKAKSGFGSDVVANIGSLVTLGGFVGPIRHAAEGSHVMKQMHISHGNVLPATLLRASRSVLHTLDALRDSLYQHGASGIAGLGRKFRIIDDDNNRQLSRSEFTKAIREHAMDLSDAEITELFDFMDGDNSGGINFDEFLVAIRGELNDRRQQLVLAAFNVFDADKSGVIDLIDIQQRYNADKHPAVLAGEKTKDEVYREFLDTFDGGDKDGKIHPREFVRYYANVSASIDDDAYFELMIRNAWHMSGGDGAAANTTCRRVLVTHADGRQTVEEVKDDIGISSTNVEAIRANLQAQGIEDVKSVEVSGATANVSESQNKRSGDDAFAPKQQFVKKKQHGAGTSSIVFG